MLSNTSEVIFVLHHFLSMHAETNLAISAPEYFTTSDSLWFEMFWSALKLIETDQLVAWNSEVLINNITVCWSMPEPWNGFVIVLVCLVCTRWNSFPLKALMSVCLCKSPPTSIMKANWSASNQIGALLSSSIIVSGAPVGLPAMEGMENRNAMLNASIIKMSNLLLGEWPVIESSKTECPCPGSYN